MAVWPALVPLSLDVPHYEWSSHKSRQRGSFYMRVGQCREGVGQWIHWHRTSLGVDRFESVVSREP